MSKRSAIPAVRWVLAGSAFQRILGFVGVGIVSRLLAPQEDAEAIFGAFEQLVALHLVVAALLPLGFDQLVIRETRLRRIYIRALRGGVLATWAILAAAAVAFQPLIAAGLSLGARESLLLAFPAILLLQAVKWGIKPLLSAELAFRRISSAEAVNTAVFVTVGCGLLAIWPEAWALYAGYALGEALEAFLLWRGRKPGQLLDGGRNISAFRELLLRHKRFCTVMTADQGVNNFSNRSPSLLLAALIGPAAVGLFGFANRLISAPVFLLMSAVGRVTLPALAGLEEGELRRRTLLTLRASSALIPPVLIWFAIHAPAAVGLVLGMEWQASVSPLLQWLALNVLFQVLFSPVSVLDVLRDRPEVTLWWNVANLGVRAAALFFAAPYGVVAAIAAYSIVSALMWNVYGLLLGRLLGAGQFAFCFAWARYVPLWGVFALLTAAPIFQPGVTPFVAAFIGLGVYGVHLGLLMLFDREMGGLLRRLAGAKG